MAIPRPSSLALALMVYAVFLFLLGATSAQLSPTFYSATCPAALPIIRSGVAAAVSSDYRMGASLLRMHFHDCFVNGCEASVLLDDTPTLKGEKTAAPNKDSLRGFEVIDSIKSQLENACPKTFSCADILAVAARDSVVALGGPSWSVGLGRRDSTTASFDAANNDLPPPVFDLSDLVSAFAKKGLSTTDMVALSGAHTIGQARCTTFRDRVNTETNIDASFATSRKSGCPSSGADNSLAPLDAATNTVFDNYYYRNLVNGKGLLHSDQALFKNVSTDDLVRTYSTDAARFFSDFKVAMVKMGNIGLLTGTSGQVRVDCKKVN